jgi:hypothetical protein
LHYRSIEEIAINKSESESKTQKGYFCVNWSDCRSYLSWRNNML